MERDFEGSVAVVTGAADGIGAATARRLHAEGALLALVDIRPEPLREVATELGGRTLALPADVGSEADVNRCIAATLAEFGRLDLAMLNAGVASTFVPLVETATADFDRVVATNLRGCFLTLRAVAREMVGARNGGAIVATASMFSLQGGAGIAPYAATKHAVLGLVRSAALELAASGIRVNAVCPGYIDTAMLRAAEELQGDAVAARASMEKLNAFGRYGTPAEVAALAAWLLSGEASYCSGGAFPVDGSITAGSVVGS